MQTNSTGDRRLVKRKRMHEELVEMLSEDIRSGVFAVGDALPSERELMEEFGVSRLTVREALGALEKSGLIAVRPGTRARVCEPSSDRLVELLSGTATFYISQPEGLRNFQDVRTLVETGLARMAAERATPEDIAGLGAILEANRASVGDTEAFARTDMDFHLAIARIVGNPMLDAFYLAVDRWLHEVRLVTLAHEGQMETAFAAHQRIFDAIRARDADRAFGAMREHLLQVNSMHGPEG
ncbi:FCD domain-containing protein [Oceanicella sp. SM1341]|uniref:FCD domain-containing protein n=1 Tax=Oceanicella sp. SM1341 TaxID=1548889 RepID=UPI000E4C6402|nr:FCD domain-containing protein [Oceanicella sp. SM1341]